MADDPNGGLRQYIKLVIDKSGLAQLKTDAKEMGQAAAQEVASALTGAKVTGAVKELGGKTLGAIRELGQHVAQQLSIGLQLAGPQLVQSAGQQVKKYVDQWKQGVQQVKNALSLVKIPDVAPIGPSARRSLTKQYGKDTDEFRAAVQRLQLATQIANTRLGPFGQLLQKIGVNAYQSSPKLQAMIQQLHSVSGVTQGAKGLLGGFGATLGSLGKTVLGLVKNLGLLTTAYRVFQLLKSSAEAAGETQASWARLSSTLADYGRRLSSVQPQIEKLVASQLQLGFKERDTVETFTTLVQLTGDYQKSLRGTSIVMDLMVARHWSLEQASKAVGRAIEGDYMALSRMGIYLDKDRDALDQLNERMGGEAKARLDTFVGQLEVATAALDQLKIAIGNALVDTSSGAGNPMQTWITFLTDMKAIVLENKDTFQLLAGVLNVLLRITLPLLKGAFVGISGAIKLVESLLGVLYVGFTNIPDAASSSFNRVVQHAAEMGAKLETIWNKVFKTSHDGFAQMAKDAKSAADAADKRTEGRRGDVVTGLMTIWAPPSEAGPKAPDQQLGNAGKVTGREDQLLNEKIRKLSALLLSKNPQFSEEAQKQLNDLLAQQEQRLEELKSTDESRAKNAGIILDVEKHITDIKAAQTKYDKQLANVAAQRRADAERMGQIERLGRITREGASKDQLHASTQLVALEQQITKERDQQVKYSERYWVLTSQIDAVQQQQQQTAHAQDEAFTKTVKDLADRVRLHVAEGQAMGELRDLQAHLNQEYNDALKITDTTQRLEALRVITARQALVDQAMRTQLTQVEAQAEKEIDQLKDPATRNQAEKDLLKLRAELIRMEQSRKALGLDIINEDRLILEINQAINATKELDLKNVREQVRDADKEAKHYGGRKKALDIYQDQLKKINDELARTDISDDRRHDDEAIKDELERKVRAVQEPVNTLYQDVIETFREELPDIIKQGADKATNAWVNGLSLIIKSSKDAKKNVQEMFRGIGKAYASEIAEVAKVKVKEHIASSVGHLAKAAGDVAEQNYGAAAKEVEAAGLDLLSAAKWGLLAGAAGNAAGGAGGSGGSSRNTNGTANANTPIGPSVFIRVDGIDPKNPRHQELVGETLQQQYQRTGGQLFTSAG